ncbi:MAG: DUF481 domain-containing protein [Candidatus Aminicenantes bacterium]|nr:DUF481 domain-containing protein [Candidatus Aminicenantes bacterium]
MQKRVSAGLLVAASLSLMSYSLFAQDTDGNPNPSQTAAQIADWKSTAPRVFLDFDRGDMDYIRKEIPFVNYVRDRKEADVHILVTTQSTGSGGTEFAMAFIGQGTYETMSSNLIYASSTTDTDDEIRRGYVSILKMGLIPYVAQTPIRDLLSIECREEVQPTDVVDPWKFWVFSLSVGAELDSETQQKRRELSFSASANKITPEMKIRLGLSAEFDRDEFSYDEGVISSHADNIGFAGLYAKSMGEHWSVGIYLAAGSSTFSNIDYRFSPAPVVEYNLFPYSESTRRQLRFQYRVGFDFVRYREETIYEKIKENLVGQSLSATLEIKEPWGSLSSSLQGSHYFHDFKKNKVDFFTELSFRIFKGLEFNVDISYERIRDQLSLPKGDASLEEILLRRKELAKDYEFGFDVRLSYTFGSVFSNVVNPRFGSLGSNSRY